MSMKINNRLRWFAWLVEQDGMPDDSDNGTPKLGSSDSGYCPANYGLSEEEYVAVFSMARISTKNTDRLRMGYEEAKALTIENGFLTEADWLYIDSLILIEEL
jgi:hypothetical protein